MVMCGAVVDEKDIQRLIELGVKDSKLLTAKKREMLFEPIKSIVKSYKLVIIEPKEIDDSVNSETTNLNQLESFKTAIILNELEYDRAIVDCPSNNIPAYQEFLEVLLKKKINLTLEHNAERNIPVAAASILAKVTRDRIIADLCKKYGDLGSGYPADPKVIKFLKENRKKDLPIFRKSWATYKKLDQKGLKDY